jgi:arylsulfatase A-like enzyme
MRIVLFDIDTLRPDHLGCYGYHRNTSPNIDRIASDAVRFERCFASDAPCLPSRSAFHHGRFGIKTGAINHGGFHADPAAEGATRGFQTSSEHRHFIASLQKAGYHTATVSSFAGRHSAWWFLAGFNEVYDCGKGGMERADEVVGQAEDFVERMRDRDNWLLHFNVWDPHTPYRVPDAYGNPFSADPAPDWLTQALLDQQNTTYGPHSASTTLSSPLYSVPTSRQVARISTPADFRTWIDGYDTGIRYADDAVGRVLAKLAATCGLDDVAIMVTSDHGENHGELNVYGDHQTADLITNRVPMIIRWPGVKPGVDTAMHYQLDVAATIVELTGGSVPAAWDGISFAEAFKAGRDCGRDYLVVSQACWSCQRAVIWDDYILIKTYEDGLKDFPPLMLFNSRTDPHETHNLVAELPGKVSEGLARLEEWLDENLRESGTDPMYGVITEGGPFHTRGRLAEYMEYYQSIGKPEIADRMAGKYSNNPCYTNR